MFSNGLEDWLGIVSVITILSGWANYIVVKPLKEMMSNQSNDIKDVKKQIETFKKDVRADFDTLENKVQDNVDELKEDISELRERVVINEHEIITIKDRLSE